MYWGFYSHPKQQNAPPFLKDEPTTREPEKATEGKEQTKEARETIAKTKK